MEVKQEYVGVGEDFFFWPDSVLLENMKTMSKAARGYINQRRRKEMRFECCASLDNVRIVEKANPLPVFSKSVLERTNQTLILKPQKVK